MADVVRPVTLSVSADFGGTGKHGDSGGGVSGAAAPIVTIPGTSAATMMGGGAQSDGKGGGGGGPVVGTTPMTGGGGGGGGGGTVLVPAPKRFFFRRRTGRLDWRKLSRIDLMKVVVDVDIAALQDNIENITFADVGDGQCTACVWGRRRPIGFPCGSTGL
jgi:hypothetical protein